ncbi:MAG: recombination protein O N-terminal domain-containing protein, partial [Oceanicaulis sp.]
MEWSGSGRILSVRPHGETSAVIEVLTPEHGRHAGLVRGGRSKTLRPVLQPGNRVGAVWRARLEDHLGAFQVEAEALSAGA